MLFLKFECDWCDKPSLSGSIDVDDQEIRLLHFLPNGWVTQNGSESKEFFCSPWCRQKFNEYVEAHATTSV